MLSFICGELMIEQCVLRTVLMKSVQLEGLSTDQRERFDALDDMQKT